MGKIRWYKRDPVAWLHGTRMLTREERGDYADVIELIMSHDGKLLDDDQHIARWIGCHWRTWKATKARLIELGKLAVEDGYLVNKRCSREAQEVLKIVSERVQAGRQGGLKSADVGRKNKELAEAFAAATVDHLTTNNRDSDSEKESLLRKPKKEISAGHRSHSVWFAEFWAAFPKRVSKAAAARSFEAAMRKSTPEAIMSGVHRYAEWIERNAIQTQFVKMPVTWLNQGCWDDELEDNGSNERPSAKTQILNEYDAMVARASENYAGEGGRGRDGSFHKGKIVDIRRSNGALLGSNGKTYASSGST